MQWKTFGHESAKRLLEKQLLVLKFPHAYLFAGPDGVGKKTLAFELAEKILGTERIIGHPDFQLFDEVSPSAEQVREFITRVSFKPFVADFKISVINNVDQFNITSLNALLKTLEEPADKNVIILISSKNAILPTVMSRCQLVLFNRLSLSQLESFSGANSLTFSPEEIVLSAGLIGRLRALSENKEKLKQLKEKIAILRSLKGLSAPHRLGEMAQFAELEPEELQELLELWLYAEQQQLARDIGKYEVLKAIVRALEELQTNKNKKLILQGLMFNL